MSYLVEWWTGYVIDRNDPEMRGRVRVKINAFHTGDERDDNIGLGWNDTKELPWAMCAMPMNLSGTLPPAQAPVDSFVFGISLDGRAMNELIVLGRLGEPTFENALHNGDVVIPASDGARGLNPTVDTANPGTMMSKMSSQGKFDDNRGYLDNHQGAVEYMLTEGNPQKSDILPEGYKEDIRKLALVGGEKWNRFLESSGIKSLQEGTTIDTLFDNTATNHAMAHALSEQMLIKYNDDPLVAATAQLVGDVGIQKIKEKNIITDYGTDAYINAVEELYPGTKDKLTNYVKYMGVSNLKGGVNFRNYDKNTDNRSLKTNAEYISASGKYDSIDTQINTSLQETVLMAQGVGGAMMSAGVGSGTGSLGTGSGDGTAVPLMSSYDVSAFSTGKKYPGPTVSFNPPASLRIKSGRENRGKTWGGGDTWHCVKGNPNYGCDSQSAPTPMARKYLETMVKFGQTDCWYSQEQRMSAGAYDCSSWFCRALASTDDRFYNLVNGGARRTSELVTILSRYGFNRIYSNIAISNVYKSLLPGDVLVCGGDHIETVSKASTTVDGLGLIGMCCSSYGSRKLSFVWSSGKKIDAIYRYALDD